MIARMLVSALVSIVSMAMSTLALLGWFTMYLIIHEVTGLPKDVSAAGAVVWAIAAEQLRDAIMNGD